ncbi:MAG TPA: hypothetical protein PK228_05000 [Saprospiraceae bacterium]|nr:hypothetical protein [Saprospiraceae bacterium]
MNLEKYLVVAGIPGVHKLVTSRANGVVIEDRKEKRTRFVPARQQQITPIATVGIFTETEEGTVSLTDVFQKMLDQYEENPPVSLESASAAFRDYFTKILPEHDRDRVHINDIKKCIKWFNFMYENGIFEEAKREAEAQAAAEKAEEKNIEQPAGMEAKAENPVETKAAAEKPEKPVKTKAKA